MREGDSIPDDAQGNDERSTMIALYQTVPLLRVAQIEMKVFDFGIGATLHSRQ